jgi:hypothetical protein
MDFKRELFAECGVYYRGDEERYLSYEKHREAYFERLKEMNLEGQFSPQEYDYLTQGESYMYGPEDE